MHRVPRRSDAMSVPNADPDEFEYEMMRNVTTYVYDGNGSLIRVEDAGRKPRPIEPKPKPEPKAEITFDRTRHVIKIKEPGGRTLEFDDRPMRFLVMDRNPV